MATIKTIHYFTNEVAKQSLNNPVDYGNAIFLERYETPVDGKKLENEATKGVFLLSASVDIELPPTSKIDDGWNATFILTTGASTAASIITSSKTTTDDVLLGHSNGEFGSGSAHKITFVADEAIPGDRIDVSKYGTSFYVQGFSSGAAAISFE